MSDIVQTVYDLAGPQRNKTFAAAAEFILKQKNPILIETGCYRGAACDGQSTLILAMLAKETGGSFFSFDISLHHIELAQQMLSDHDMDEWCAFCLSDSLNSLKDIRDRKPTFAYLDSYDFELERPINSQAHQLAEAAILLPKMAPVSAFLLDDCDIPHGGKARLSSQAILACGYKEVATAYQRLFIRQ